MKAIELMPIHTSWARLAVVISGTRPLLLHDRLAMERMRVWAAQHPREKAPSPEIEAEMGVLRSDQGVIQVRSDMILECAKQGAKEVLVSRPSGGRKVNATKIISAGVYSIAESFDLLRPTKPLDEYADVLQAVREAEPIMTYDIDIRRVMVQGNGVMRARARIEPPWIVYAEMVYDAGIGDPEHLPRIFQQSLGYGGQMVGIGDYRPQRGGSFGRFEVRGMWILEGGAL